jgi:hypothetical protein
MHAWIIPAALLTMALVGWALQPNNLDRLWWNLEGWINGDPPMPMPYEVIFIANEDTDFLWQQVERHPMCPGEGCPHQMYRWSVDPREPYAWTGEYCWRWRYLP